MLALVAIVAAAACSICAAIFLRRGPALTVALVGFLAGGALGFVAASADGPRDVPADAAISASCGLIVGGLVGVAFAPAHADPTFLRRAAWWFFGLAPVVAGIVAVLLRYACPLYVTDHAGFCYHRIDVLGGWISTVTVLVLLDMVALAVVCRGPAGRSSRQPRDLDEAWGECDPGIDVG